MSANLKDLVASIVRVESSNFSIKNASSIRFRQKRPSAGFADLALFSILNADSSILSETWFTIKWDYHNHIWPSVVGLRARVTHKKVFPGPNKIEIFSRCAIRFNLRPISAKVLVFSIFSDFSNSGRSKAVMESITISLTLLTKHQRSLTQINVHRGNYLVRKWLWMRPVHGVSPAFHPHYS